MSLFFPLQLVNYQIKRLQATTSAVIDANALMFLVLLVLLPRVLGFLFHSDANVNQCYELDLENCFREAFLAAMHPPFRKRKELHNNTIHDKRKARADFFLCHDVRRLSSCFMYPGCTDQMAATIASVQYHMVYGKKLPMHVFLAYRGFGKQMCDQACSRDSVFICRRTMTKEEQEEEQGHLLEMSTLALRIAPDLDNSGTCSRIKQALSKVLASRVRNCGDAARCTCEDALSDTASLSCGLNCEQLENQEQRALLSGASTAVSSLILLAFFFFV